ncbi:MAG: hypothetical protein QOG15_2335 [Solirubrobacteraceae bacterium]|jgi:hypothetical protein|nr:hypothetical protein [Solirubrobacteraceae bacterium]
MNDEPEQPRNDSKILLAALAAALSGGGAIAVVVALAKGVLS